MQERDASGAKAAGFSLLELMIAMAVTLVIMLLASSLVAGSFNIRNRENQKTDALADSQRALNLMTREIANAGYGLNDNGIVSADSGVNSIRVRANLNAAAGETTSNTATDRDEDIKYLLYTDSSNSYIVRLDVNTAAQEMVLANRVDALNIRYYGDKVYYTTSNCDISNVQDALGNAVSEVPTSNAKYIVISICVQLPAVGTFGSPGYQPISRVQLVSDATLRNADLVNY
jgi:prepilin-type N-terminal cleavage/methylation domain-containing protein